MASHPIPAVVNGNPGESLSHDEWWDLFDHLRLSQQAAYAELGGPVAFIRHERDADEPLA